MPPQESTPLLSQPELIDENDGLMPIGIADTFHNNQKNDANGCSDNINMPARTPLPTKQLVVLMTVILCEPFQFTILFPFIVFMVESFGVAPDSESLGYYVGFITAAFAGAQCLSALPWGTLSDRIGRRPVLLLGLAGNACAVLT
ncbi:uncharacterized protein SPPG_09242 [Spizellomyces punctatus DAOM BR117]|uniref:Major facilitator superfamily (MFS) profile domain-containing protein n=1 Tax=Spizellomyces punctatus (strain DAOM BR117) TaxID=645134 RepID=A0A0L0HEY5_SPIPD|nr:uncharacterized protein SPPG_09242 [Spizellomyces punctatus DAOM BR117]KNC99652.1 hypothetical protein SPPG_09242 [Spizellomyces punctatus DAOM BR117]|eukprot:XP_016607692.1 hypothetical protein SPPG_09242 [Spizellomyces punctatus DAOM BR117]